MSTVLSDLVARTRDVERRAACPGCGSALDLHQPDIELPERLLGVCESCKGWYVLDGEWNVVHEVTFERAPKRRSRPGSPVGLAVGQARRFGAGPGRVG